MQQMEQEPAKALLCASKVILCEGELAPRHNANLYHYILDKEEGEIRERKQRQHERRKKSKLLTFLEKYCTMHTALEL